MLISGVFIFSCNQPKTESNDKIAPHDSLVYLNHADSARYVGINTCKLCHQKIYDTYIKTGMGKSFDIATKQKSAGNYQNPIVYDKIGDFYYRAFWLKDSLQILEYRLEGKDTVYKRIEHVNYIIGSGQHTNSHLQSVNGYLNQMPMTFYTQKQQWDLPPGFQNGHNSRFMRKIGLECMSCHNNYPEFILGSENKFTAIPEGISCERCHGPGSIHVAQKQAGIKIDTSKNIDYSIVNPAKLSIDTQFDICQRCHLQGNTVLKEGKSFYDFKPGMKLSNYMTVFLPKYKYADDEFIMASHADRLKQSSCFIKSIEIAKTAHTNSLKPYKDAMTCVTCHNPHVSVRETNPNVFNDACNSCHHVNGKSKLTCSDEQVKKISSNLKSKSTSVTYSSANCVNCHMPKSGSIDIPHVTVHDHYIRKPITKNYKQKIKKFIGLYAINEKKPDYITKAKAYLNQYEKFENKMYLLDSAKFYLKDKTISDIRTNIEPLVQLYFIKNNYTQIINYVNTLTDIVLLNELFIKQTYSNDNAWTCYRIGESFYNIGDIQRATNYYKKAVDLAPFILDFKNKYGSVLAEKGLLKQAEIVFSEILSENPKHLSSLTNLGYIKLTKGDIKTAEILYFKGLSLDPDNEALLLNIAGFFAYKKDFLKAKIYLNKLLKLNPNNFKAKNALNQIKQMH